MYKKIQQPLPPKFGRMYVDKFPPDMGPPRAKDIVTIGIADDIDFYILVHAVEGTIIKGEIVAIGPSPREVYNEWKRSDRIEVEEASVRAIIRDD